MKWHRRCFEKSYFIHLIMFKVDNIEIFSGDFAIVFQSGVSIRRVLFLNYITSCACFIGVAIGIALGNLQWSQYIFAFASGLFLIIALSNMVKNPIF